MNINILYIYILFMAFKRETLKKPTANKKSVNGPSKVNVWTSKRVDEWMKDYAEGIIHKESPWADGVVGVRNPNLIFEYTQEEIEEITKCANDIIYFANNYCYCLQGSKGYQPIVLRDYQVEMLSSYVNNRFSICCSSRQIGKCSFNSYINTVDSEGNENEVTLNDVYTKFKKHTILSKIKLYLYKLYKKL